MRISDLKPGDLVYVEDSFGQLNQKTVKSIDRYHIIIGSQRFYKKTGWEVQFKGSRFTKGLQLHRDRIHYGDGLLFTEEEAEKRRNKRKDELRQEELIYQLKHLTTRQLRKVNLELLEDCVLTLSQGANRWTGN